MDDDKIIMVLVIVAIAIVVMGVVILNPFAPKTVKNIWNTLFKNVDIDSLNFPQFDEKYLKENTIQYPVMINGKTRAQIIVNKNASEDEIKNNVFNNVKL